MTYDEFFGNQLVTTADEKHEAFVRLLDTESGTDPEMQAFLAMVDQLVLLATLLDASKYEMEIPQPFPIGRFLSHPFFQEALARFPLLGEVYPALLRRQAFTKCFRREVSLRRPCVGRVWRVGMPTDTYRLPVAGSVGSEPLLPEPTAPAPPPLEQLARMQSYGIHDIPGTMILVARKQAVKCRLALTEKTSLPAIREDNLGQFLPALRDAVLDAFATAQEDILWNGSVLPRDADRRSPHDHLRLFNGLRTLVESYIPYSGDLVADVRRMWRLFNKVIPSQDVMFVLSEDAYRVQQACGIPPEIDGIPIRTSELIRNDLGPTGVHTGPHDARSLALLVRPSHFLFGDYRCPSIRARRLDEQTVDLVAIQRIAFAPFPEHVVGGICDLPTSRAASRCAQPETHAAGCECHALHREVR